MIIRIGKNYYDYVKIVQKGDEPICHQCDIFTSSQMCPKQCEESKNGNMVFKKVEI